MDKKERNVLIIGTGTIGEPLIGLLSDFKDKFNINVFFHKKTAMKEQVSKVNSLTKRGAKLVVDHDRWRSFVDLGHEPNYNFERALELADIVIDCTPVGNENRTLFYEALSAEDKYRLFIAQGSEKNFGMPYAYGINDSALEDLDHNFIQVVSCNTHNISSLVKTLSNGDTTKNFIKGDFTCIRRANDISQAGGFIASPEVGKHKDGSFGTHHAKDAYDLFGTMHANPNLFSSAMKINSQYMHIIRFNIEIKGSSSMEDVIQKFKDNKFVALTYKNLANKVFSFGRDHGYYGRIFNHTVVARDSLSVQSTGGTTIVSGFCYTPQDGNSLLSSVAATLFGLYGDNYEDYMEAFDDLLFDEI